MKLLKVKTARFAEVVQKCGAPAVLTLWQDPKSDKALQRALREQRVMTLHQTVTGAAKDFGEVGFTSGAGRSHLVFPRSLKNYAGRRIVGIKYELLEG